MAAALGPCALQLLCATPRSRSQRHRSPSASHSSVSSQGMDGWFHCTQDSLQAGAWCRQGGKAAEQWGCKANETHAASRSARLWAAGAALRSASPPGAVSAEAWRSVKVGSCCQRGHRAAGQVCVADSGAAGQSEEAQPTAASGRTRAPSSIGVCPCCATLTHGTHGCHHLALPAVVFHHAQQAPPRRVHHAVCKPQLGAGGGHQAGGGGRCAGAIRQVLSIQLLVFKVGEVDGGRPQGILAAAVPAGTSNGGAGVGGEARQLAGGAGRPAEPARAVQQRAGSGGSACPSAAPSGSLTPALLCGR